MYDKTVKDWVVLPSNKEFVDEIKVFEGTKEYQKKMGYVKNGKFIKYKDSLGYWTIGYGHLILEGENFDNGIDDSTADTMIIHDITNAANDAKKLFTKYKMKLPERAQYVLTGMVFQLGIQKTSKFVNFLTALSKNDYKKAANEMRNSAWYKQTPNRVDALAKDLEKLV